MVFIWRETPINEMRSLKSKNMFEQQWVYFIPLELEDKLKSHQHFEKRNDGV